MENTTFGNGYDLAVYGLDNDQFYVIHIPALCFIFTSLICVITILVVAFKTKNFRTFFSWTKSERFVVYLAVCDGLFNIAHSLDHLHIIIVKDHVRPFWLCEVYGFTLAEFISAQNLMVNVIAINAFVLIYFNRNLNFGKYDWRLLLWTFGLPFVGALAAAISGQLGPNGTFCYFDGVNGEVSNIFFTTVPLFLILAINIVSYSLTFHKLRRESRDRRKNIGKISCSASHRAARNMSLFVVAFFVQWWSLALYGAWQLISADVPQVIFQLVTTFVNTGGILNGIVYFIIRRRQRAHRAQKRTSSNPQSRTSVSPFEEETTS